MIGHARDGVRGRLQIVYGLLCTTDGVPVAIEVFEGNTANPKTLAAQISKLTTRFGLDRVCLVGDRGMLTSARIRDELRPGGLDWITALRAPQIKALVEADALQLSLFDEHNLVEISSPDYPGERLVCCRNPALAAERARKRDELLAATATELDKIAAATRRDSRPLRGRDKIALRVGKVINKFKMAKHFTLEITDEAFTFAPTTTTSPPRPPSTGSMCCAPACPSPPCPPTMWWHATRDSKMSSGSSAPSTPSWTCGPSATAWPAGSARTCSYACCPTT